MIDFWGVGWKVAERMGLIPRLREVGYKMERIVFVDAQDRVRSELGGDIFSGAVGDQFISLPRGDLARAIYDLIEGRVEVIYGDSVTALDEQMDGVEATFEHAAPRKFDLVAGCDGLHSVVREKVFGTEEQFEKYLGYQTASFITEDYARRDELTYLSFGAPGRQISRYALRGGRTAFFFVFACGRARRAKDPRAWLRETFAQDDWVEIPEILRALDRCDDLYFDSVSQIRMPAWSRGRSVLLGDAASCPSLLAGEGTAFAMAGAYILAGELAHADGDFRRAFAAYEEKFRPFIERKQRSAARFANSFAPRTRFGLFVRDQVLNLASRFRPMADFLMRQFVRDDFVLPRY